MLGLYKFLLAYKLTSFLSHLPFQNTILFFLQYQSGQIPIFNLRCFCCMDMCASGAYWSTGPGCSPGPESIR